MDQPNSTSPVQTPHAAVEKIVVNKELPHLVVEEPKRGIFGTLGVLVLSLALLVGIPLGIYLVSQRTQIAPKAAVVEEAPEVMTGILLESKLSPESAEAIPVDIFVKSPNDFVNLVDTKIRFDPNLLSVDKIATGSGEFEAQSFFNKWIEVSFDNNKGSISIISGLPNPGVKTQGAGGDKAYLATLHLKPKKAGTAILQIKPESQILRNSDNNNIFKTGNDLVLSLTGAAAEASNSATPLPKSKENQEPLVVITSPGTAQNYSYFNPININWSSFNVDRISQINLYVNGKLLGPITQNLKAQDAQFSWEPQDTLALPYIQLSNTYYIEIVGVSKDGEAAKAASGPFGIVGTEQPSGLVPNPEAFSQNQLSITDASRVLSSYLVLPLKDQSLDLNKDEVINELDLFLVRQNLLMRGVIK